MSYFETNVKFSHYISVNAPLDFQFLHRTFNAWLVAEAQAGTGQIRLRKVVVSMVLPEAQIKMLPKSGGEHGLAFSAWACPPPP